MQIQCIGFGVTVAPASTIYSALLCKSCPCCQFGGAPFVADREGVLLFRVLCHSGAGESRVQRSWAACQGSRGCWGGQSTLAELWG